MCLAKDVQCVDKIKNIMYSLGQIKLFKQLKRGGLIMFLDEIIVTVNCRNRTCGKVDVTIKKEGDEWIGYCPICGNKILSMEIKKEKKEE